MRRGSKLRRSMSMIMLAVALAIVSICGNVTTSDALKTPTKKHPWRLAKKMSVRIGSDWKTQSFSVYEKFDDFNHDGEEDVESLENLKIKILTPKSKWKKKIKAKTGSFEVKYSKRTGEFYGSDAAISVKGLKKGTVTLKLKCTGRFEKRLGYDTEDKSKKKTIKGKKISFTTKVKITVKAAKKKTTKKKTTETEETEATPTPEPTETPVLEDEEDDYGYTPAPTDATN